MQEDGGRGKEKGRERREADCRERKMFHNLFPLTSLFSCSEEQRTLYFLFCIREIPIKDSGCKESPLRLIPPQMEANTENFTIYRSFQSQLPFVLPGLPATFLNPKCKALKLIIYFECQTNRLLSEYDDGVAAR